MSKFFIFLAGTTGAVSFNRNDYPNYQFNCKGWNGDELELNQGNVCKWIRCKYFTKHKATNIEMKTVPESFIQCPSLEESGCPTTWGFEYAKGKNVLWTQATHTIVPSSKMKHSSKTGFVTITCVHGGASNKAKCTPTTSSGDAPGSITFAWVWKKNQTVPCLSQGASSWGLWNANNNVQECEPQVVTRKRACLNGIHPGTLGPCEDPVLDETQTKVFWPSVCGKCHYDGGMQDEQTAETPHGDSWSSYKDHVEAKFDDGFIPVGKGVYGFHCYDQPYECVFDWECASQSRGMRSMQERGLKKFCICTDQDGCHFDGFTGPMCVGPEYEGYGIDYLWRPGAPDTFKKTHVGQPTTVEVNDDFTINYTDPATESDPRFKNSVKWWENGPPICRYTNNGVLFPGAERPLHKNDDGSIDTKFSNWLTCFSPHDKFPGAGFQTLPSGSKAYEVLTSEKTLTWIKASSVSEDELYKDMVVTGTHQYGAKFDRAKNGLCRLEPCSTGHCPGVLAWSSYELSCIDFFKNKNFKEKNPDKFQVLMNY